MDISKLITETLTTIRTLAEKLPPPLRFIIIIYSGSLVIWLILIPTMTQNQILTIIFASIFLVFGLVIILVSTPYLSKESPSDSQETSTTEKDQKHQDSEKFIYTMLEVLDSHGNSGLTFEEWKKEVKEGLKEELQNYPNFDQLFEKFSHNQYVSFSEMSLRYRLSSEGKAYLRSVQTKNPLLK